MLRNWEKKVVAVVGRPLKGIGGAEQAEFEAILHGFQLMQQVGLQEFMETD